MNKIIKTGMFFLMAGMMAACQDVFVPEPENNLPLGYLDKNSTYAENVLGNVYNYLPGLPFNDPATDDAVSNDAQNSWRRIASGSWTSNNNPMNRWENCRSGVQYCNIFLSKLDDVTWTKDEDANKLFHDRFYGEALALRAIMNFYLLEAHGGKDNAGNLLGIPIVEDVYDHETSMSEFNSPRNTYAETVAAIKKDFETAKKYLPTEFTEEYFGEVRQMYPGISEGNLNRVFGSNFVGRVCGRIINGYLSRLTIMAASPAFEASGVTWEEAANAAAAVISRGGALKEVQVDGGTWYCASNIDKLEAADCPPEVLWRTTKGNSRNLEEDNFPPTLYGKGRINPTQNLVDAFPMMNGYPISDSRSGYDPQNPYADRDPRLSQYIIYNGAKAGSDNREIQTLGRDTNDGIDMISTSTRTGYYMKKLLNMEVNCNPSNTVDKYHYTARMRYTEFMLNYAEAANEAWGPTGTGSNSFSAYDVIKEIRKRAGIGLENGDEYLESCKGDKAAMRDLIRNERRLELCFEGFRFYDVRRWKADINENAMGMSLVNGVYTPFVVETRNYKDYMIYGPIPYSEVLKFSNLQQNAGW